MPKIFFGYSWEWHFHQNYVRCGLCIFLNNYNLGHVISQSLLYWILPGEAYCLLICYSIVLSFYLWSPSVLFAITPYWENIAGLYCLVTQFHTGYWSDDNGLCGCQLAKLVMMKNILASFCLCTTVHTRTCGVHRLVLYSIGFFYCSSPFSVPKSKNSWSQTELLFSRIL